MNILICIQQNEIDINVRFYTWFHNLNSKIEKKKKGSSYGETEDLQVSAGQLELTLWYGCQEKPVCSYYTITGMCFRLRGSGCALLCSG